MLKDPELSKTLKSLPATKFEGTLFRIIASRFIATPLSAIGPTVDGGRYNPRRTCEALYRSFSVPTAFAEVAGYAVTDPKLSKMKGPPRSILSIDCVFERLLDVSDADVQKALDTNAAELRAEWRYSHLALGVNTPTQELGRALFNSGDFHGIIAPSARDNNFNNVVVFPERLVAGARSYLEIFDPFGIVRARIPYRTPLDGVRCFTVQ